MDCLTVFFFSSPIRAREAQMKKRLTAILGRDPTLEEQASSAGLATGEYQTLLAEGHAARQRIIVSNIALVASIASKYSDKSLPDRGGSMQVSQVAASLFCGPNQSVSLGRLPHGPKFRRWEGR